MWQVRWRNRAEDDLAALPRQVQQRVATAIDRLAETGQGSVRKLQGQPPRMASAGGRLARAVCIRLP